ncbi:MAG: hypothetical protein Q7K26_00825 [bacterium]|nr:hypothetical protein [bacterium]
MKQDKRSRISVITLDITATRRQPSNATRRFQTPDPQDVAIFCSALGLGSTDASWYDDLMDTDPFFAGHC